MADIIHLLPDSVANQIAAGEVIQRPASVIKELLENAVDAGASRIDVLVVDAGRTSIQVIDNGKGMSETDARLAFERHATSKITEASDLFLLRTMGFRGEALPSIAAVAQVTLRTRSAESDLGTSLSIEGGRVVSQEVDSCPVGANFLVQNLFFNVPARRKFLKSNQTELSNIIQEYERVALVNPHIHFTFTSDGNNLSTLLPETPKQRITSLFGKKLGDQLLDIHVDTTLCQIQGYVGRPDSAKRKGARQYFFVNGRYMRHPFFHRAVQAAFEEIVPATEQVPYILFLTVDPATIDVNIHPTKTEIKFENEVAIWQILLAAIKEALGRFNAIPTIEFDTEGRPGDIPTYNPTNEANSRPSFPKVQTDAGYNPFAHTSVRATSGYSPFQEENGSSRPVPRNWEMLYGKEVPNTEPLISDDDPQTGAQRESAAQELNLQASERSVLHYQYRGQYIVTEIRSGLMFIDQHRAHVRILYNKYLSQLASKQGASQGLLFPELLKLSMSDVPLFEQMLPDLHYLGFDISSLGGGSYSIQGIPSGLEGTTPQQLLTDMVETVKSGVQSTDLELHRRMALVLARNAAIPAGQVLSQQEMEAMVEELFQQDNPNYTPDGKLIVAIYAHDNVSKWFL